MYKSKKTDYIKWLKIAAACFMGYQILRFFKQSATAVHAQASNILVSQQTGVTGAELDVCNQVATAVYDAIFNYCYGLQEDEETVIQELNRLTSGSQARAVSLAYAQMPKHTSLKSDIIKYLSGSQQTQIHTLIRSSLT